MSKEMHESNFIWLLNWLHKHCDGNWEKANGVHIGTLDTPGWYLSVSIVGTECEGQKFKDIIVERSETDWFHCFVDDGRFEGPCGPVNLPEVIQVFRCWSQACEKKNGFRKFIPWFGKKARSSSSWGNILRVDGKGYNKVLKTYFDFPHMHDTSTPGGIRMPESWEISK